MNIHELDSYNLGDAVKFNDRLNPRIWDADEKMRPEVREQLLKIADDFREFLGIDVEVKDITVSGSNAAYTYTPHSDIDLHLVVDLPKADASEVYRELFDAKKYAYNEQHDIKIGGYDVELYVQDANKKHHSQGIYSIINNDWISVPKRRKPEVNDISVKSKFEDLGRRIEDAIKSQDYEKISALSSKIRDYRQAGLDAHGEFGPENLAFKILRTQGLIKKLYDARAEAKDQLLSLDERRKKKKKRSVKYGYGGYWYPGTAYAGQDHPAGTEGGDGGGDGGGESIRESVETADENILRDFVNFCVKELKIEQMPRVKLRKDPQWSTVHKTFGRYNDDAKTLEVAWGNVTSWMCYAPWHMNSHTNINTSAKAIAWVLTPEKLAALMKMKPMPEPACSCAIMVDCIQNILPWGRHMTTKTKNGQTVDEVKMSPGALEKFAASEEAQGIRAGFEAELIFRDTRATMKMTMTWSPTMTWTSVLTAYSRS
jgi:hypothetical protein